MANDEETKKPKKKGFSKVKIEEPVEEEEVLEEEEAVEEEPKKKKKEKRAPEPSEVTPEDDDEIGLPQGGRARMFPPASDEGDDEEIAPRTKKPMTEIVDFDFESSKLHNSELEFYSLLQCILDKDLQATLWTRFVEEHFANESTNAIFKRLSGLVKMGKEWPGLLALSRDPALPAGPRQMLASVVERIEQTGGWHDGKVMVAGNMVSVADASDYTGYIFDVLDSLRMTREGVEAMVNTVKAIHDDEDFDPLTGPSTIEGGATKALNIRSKESIDDYLLNFGAFTSTEQDRKREQELDSLFNKEADRIKTGFLNFDTRAGGILPGEVVLVGANSGGGKCITGNSMVPTSHGLLTMEEIASQYDNYVDGYAEAVFNVYGRNGVEPTSHVYKEEVQETFKITTALGFENESTGAHRVLALTNGKVDWVYQKDLKVGDVLVSAVGHRLWGSTVPSSKTEVTKQNIPLAIRTAPEKYVRSYLQELFNQEATVDSKSIIIAADSDDLHAHLKAVLANFGVSTKTFWNVGVRYLMVEDPYSIRAFVGNIGFTLEAKAALVLDLMATSVSLLMSAQQAAFDVVTSVEKKNVPVMVYDFVVPKTNSFSANGLVQHNTALMLSLMVNMARMGFPTAMLQLELTLGQLNERLSGNLAEIDTKILRKGIIPDRAQKKVRKAWEDFHKELAGINSRVTIFAPSAANVAQCEMYFKQFPYKVWFIDYVNLLAEASGSEGDGWMKLSAIVKQYKALAKKYKVAIVLAVQVNVDKESGEISVRYAQGMKEHADIVWLWNLTKEARNDGVVWINNIKARQFEPFDWQVKVELKYARFASLLSPDDVEPAPDTRKMSNKRQIHSDENLELAPIIPDEDDADLDDKKVNILTPMKPDVVKPVAAKTKKEPATPPEPPSKFKTKGPPPEEVSAMFLGEDDDD